MPHIPRAVESPILIEALVREYREIPKNGRGAGVMLGFDVVRVDWRDALLDRAFGFATGEFGEER
jgi:hypothetical protein